MRSSRPCLRTTVLFLIGALALAHCGDGKRPQSPSAPGITTPSEDHHDTAAPEPPK